MALLDTGQCTSLASAVACFESVCGACGRNEAAMMMMTMLMLAVAWAVAAQISIRIKRYNANANALEKCEPIKKGVMQSRCLLRENGKFATFFWFCFLAICVSFVVVFLLFAHLQR